MKKEYTILKKGRDNKVMVMWEREKGFFYPNGVEYSVHTESLYGGLIWGHYFTDKKECEEYFKQYL